VSRKDIKALNAEGDAYREFVLAELRCARRRAQLLLNEIEAIGLALKGKWIDADTAMLWMRDANALEFLRDLSDDASAPVADVVPGEVFLG